MRSGFIAVLAATGAIVASAMVLTAHAAVLQDGASSRSAAGASQSGALVLAQAAVRQTTADGNRKCHTIRTCRFTRGGSFRGCVSTYSCRACRPVRARCEIGGRRQNCHELRCTWGG